MPHISPTELYDDPKQWLNVPHSAHESLLELMNYLFDDFGKKLKELEVVCFACRNIPLPTLSTGEVIVGSVSKPEKLLCLR